MFKQSLSVPAIVAQLRKLCQEKQTGVLHIIDNGHLLGQINLKGGEIVALRAQKKQGADAIPIILGLENGSMAFTQGVLPSTQMTLAPTADILAIFERANPDQLRQECLPPPLTDTVKIILEQTLKEYIGPIANLICTDHFRDATALATVIDALADEIPSPQAATQFRERINQQLG
ncbi:MAG: DUF4388 domain-containing protein [Gammaproteobacteria bacterium]|nr:DUF4388 domain-containing protein [Gammaproteobacteria bacterium]MCP5196403.1 DUF4388 domain-containing protein [Gammaproteobacteria bacterium]